MAARHKEIADALVALLSGIRRDGLSIPGGKPYNLTPDRVWRVHAFDDKPFDSAVGKNVYIVRFARQRFLEEGNQTVLGKIDVGLVVASQFENSTENPTFEEAQTRAISLDLMIEDVTNALLADVTLGGLAINVMDVEEDGLLWDRERWMAGWALAEASFTVQFSVVKGQV